jgi:hypothetical protein
LSSQESASKAAVVCKVAVVPSADWVRIQRDADSSHSDPNPMPTTSGNPARRKPADSSHPTYTRRPQHPTNPARRQPADSSPATYTRRPLHPANPARRKPADRSRSTYQQRPPIGRRIPRGGSPRILHDDFPNSVRRLGMNNPRVSATRDSKSRTCQCCRLSVKDPPTSVRWNSGTFTGSEIVEASSQAICNSGLTQQFYDESSVTKSPRKTSDHSLSC